MRRRESIALAVVSLVLVAVLPALNALPPSSPFHVPNFTLNLFGKVAILVLVILFIQRRPSGLFAAKGRYADS